MREVHRRTLTGKLKNTIKYKKGKIMDPKFDKKINDLPPEFLSLYSMAIHNLRT
jgi:hypothetical protein